MHDYVHLHVHTQYSILDGQASVAKLVDKAIADGMRGLAITDHGNMMAIKEFFDYSSKVIGKGKKDLKAAQEKLQELQAVAAAAEEIAAATKEVERLERIANFKPIFGCEMYVARRGMKTKDEKIDQSGWHLVVLAKNKKGYHNLIKLVSNAWIDGFYLRPRTDHEQLLKYREGLIISSACIAGEIPNKILKGTVEEAEKAALWFKETFGDDYYLELQRHRVKQPGMRANYEAYELQQRANAELLEIGRKHNIPVICTNDVHFVNEEDAEAHDRLICLSTGKDLDDPKRMLYSKQEWFKTREEMNVIFSDLPEVLENTCRIADKVETYSINHAPIMPNFAIPEEFGTEEEYRQKITEKDLYDEFTQDEKGNVVMSEEEGWKKIEQIGGIDKLYRIKLEADYLAKLSFEGAERRYGSPLTEEVTNLIQFELHIMKTMGFPGYFLIVQDYIRAAREELDVSVGPGRGSAAGSVVAYCLGITQVDPIKYSLLFERFLNPDRISLPDVDIDFDDDGRGRVLKWVTDKYGEENVAHIITYGTMATKSAIKDVARVQRLPLSESNRLCKLIPDKLPEVDGKSPKLNLQNCIKYIPEIREAEASNDPLLHDTIKYAKMLEGNVRSTGVHACGFIICRDKISDWVPISVAEDKSTGERLHCTQYEGKVIEDTGLIKMDFLGLSTLSIIREALANIRESLSIDIDIDNINIEDPATYQLYCEGRTVGTFQFESAGMQKYLRELQPSTFEDLIAMNALYRPGPMQYIPQFIARKHGREEITYDLPCMENYLKDTYGITVYQEQVMLLSREIADFTRGESDTLRKAMGKKLIDKLNQMYPKFLEGGKAKGHDPKILEKVWEDWRAFASYAFNKSHATCYSWVAYQTAYLKANFPAHYMAAVMSRSLSDISKISKFMDECKTMGIDTLSPDVNESRLNFFVNDQGDIRFGLGAIKGVGEGAAQAIIDERAKNGAFTSIFDFVERVNLSSCNRKCIESLALAGALDGLGVTRREQLFATNEQGSYLDTLIRYGNLYQTEKSQAQNSLFGGFDSVEIAKPALPDSYERWSDLERLNKERDLIGIYISGHPLDEYKLILQHVCNTHTTELEDLDALQHREITLGGIVTAVREGFSKNGKPYGIVKIEDYEGVGEIPLFGEDWARWRGYMLPNSTLFINAKVEPKPWGSGLDLRIGKIDFLSDVKDKKIQILTIEADVNTLEESVAAELIHLIHSSSGPAELHVRALDKVENTNVLLSSPQCSIKVTQELIYFLEHTDSLNYFIN